ncbi:tetratricopeptide repeat protein [Okeania sp. SIO2B3]|uniref:tetratricopeptide repeat protein n=1 Tax=Okeania sp. SIO2B3 TaxID=2607784 RepID=UPI0013C04456|nr:hypothetical protein [Okeania sp. SIO2B3]NET44427.1 tetratricopeptide repeat protein [Okeania sp. SIO2B3]
MIRIVIAQGIIQLLNVVSVLKFQSTLEKYQNCEDFLIIAGSRNSTMNQGLIDACLQISTVWSFKNIIVPHDYVVLLSEKVSQKTISFLEATKLLKNKLTINVCDVIYTCRNFQFINELFLSAYSTAHKICYGDGLGVLDSKSMNQPGSINPQGFAKVDEAYLIVPLEASKNAFDYCGLIQTINIKYFVDTIHKSALQVPGLSQYCKSILKKNNQPITLIVLTYWAQVNIISSCDAEVELYLLSVLPYVTKDELLVVKGHPRQKLNQSQKLVDELVKNGFNAILMPNKFEYYSIELFTSYLSFKKVITIASNSCFTLAYLCHSEVIFGAKKTLVEKYISSNFHKNIKQSIAYNSLILPKAYTTSDFEPIYYSQLEQLTKNQVYEQIYIANGNFSKPQIINSNILFNKAQKLQRQGKFNQAINYYRYYLDFYPDFSWCYFKLGETLEKLGLIDDAAKEYCNAVEKNPSNLVFRYTLNQFIEKNQS